MKKLYVYADFNWLKEVELIGELGFESLRGADSYCFTFNNNTKVYLSPQIPTNQI